MANKTFRVDAHRDAGPRTDGRKGQTDSVDIQLSVTAKIPRGKTLSREVIQEAIQYRAKHGRNPKGFNVRLIRWRNPERSGGDSIEEEYTNADDAELQPGWRKYGKQSERFETLSRVLRSNRMEFSIGESKRRLVPKKTKHRKTRRKKARKKVANRRGPRKTRGRK